MIKIKLIKKSINEAEELEQQKKREVIAWKNSRWMFLDTETTGLPPDRKNPNRKDPRIVQIGYAIVDNMKVVKVFNKIVDPGADVEIDPAAAAITGIDREKIVSSKAENFLSIIQEIKNDIESCSVIMAYNIRFDKPVVEREFDIANIEIPKKNWLDPMIWVMKHLQLPSYKLSAVAEHYKISLEHAHDAGADSEAAARVTMAFVQAFDGLPDDADEIVRLQGVWNKELLSARAAAFRQKKLSQKQNG
jgi:DNA polymerase III epsilon subunit-like protein